MTVCSNCGAENPAGKRFCGDCGSALAAICSSCGGSNAPGKKFCGDCGAPLEIGGVTAAAFLPAAATPGGGRRLGVGVFSRLVGFPGWSGWRGRGGTRG